MNQLSRTKIANHRALNVIRTTMKVIPNCRFLMWGLTSEETEILATLLMDENFQHDCTIHFREDHEGIPEEPYMVCYLGSNFEITMDRVSNITRAFSQYNRVISIQGFSPHVQDEIERTVQKMILANQGR